MGEGYPRVIATGLAIFLIMYLIIYISNSHPFNLITSETSHYTSYKELLDKQGYYYLNTYDLGELGSYDVSTFTSSFGRQEVGNTLSYRIIRQENNVIIKNGIFDKQEKEFVFKTYNSKEIRLSFIVNRTNNYGKLIIIFNNRVVFRNYTYPGEKIQLDVINNITNINHLILTCESSGARIWAPDAYELKNVKLSVLDYNNSIASHTIYLSPEEYKGLKEVDLDFYVINKQGSGKLDVYVNNVLAISDTYSPSAELHHIILYKHYFHPGLNTISFSTQPDTSYTLDNLEAKVIYLATQQSSSTSLSFVLASSTKKYIESENLSAFIMFDISKVLVNKGIDVWVNNHKYSLSSLSNGKNTIIINTQDLETGINTIRITTSGYYLIPRVYIGIKKK